jgi:hypothetical protein
MRVEKAKEEDQPDVRSGYSHVQCYKKHFTPLMVVERLNGGLANWQRMLENQVALDSDAQRYF